MARARDAFWQAGFAGTSLEDLSTATGMNRPSLYAAFGDKRAMYLEALRRTRDNMLAGAAAALGSSGNLRSCLEVFYGGAINAYLAGDGEARGCFIIGTALTEAVGDAEVKAVLHETFLGLDGALIGRLEQARADGELRDDADIAALGYLLSAAVHGLAMRARAGEPRTALEAWAKGAIDHVESLSRS